MESVLDLISLGFSIITSLGLLWPAIYISIGVCIGWWSMRYYLKRDPARVEALAQQDKKLGEKLQKKD